MRVAFTILTFMFICFSAEAGDRVSIEKIEYDTTTSSVGISCVVNSSLAVSRDSICIFQDGNLVKDFSIAPGTERSQTVYIVLAFDCSKSLSSKDLSGIKRTAKDFISSADNIQISILKFDNNVMKVQPFTLVDNSFIRYIEDLKRSGKKTRLYDAVFEGIKLLESTDSSAREIIVFTDGKDEGSSVTADDVINEAKSTKVPVFFWSVGKGRKNEAMKRIAILTGGDCFSGENSGRTLSKVIIKKPKRSYLLSYKAENQVSGYHTVEVQLMSKDILGSDMSQYKSDPANDVHPVMDKMLIAVTAIGLFLIAVIVCILFVLRSRSFKQNKESFRQKAVEFEKIPEDDRTGILNKGLCRAWLMQKDGPENGKKFPLYWEETVIGKDIKCALSVNDSRVSPKHARIRFARNAFYIIDLASDEGTFVNGKKLLRPRVLNDWDEIVLGQTTFIFRSINDHV